MHANFAMTIQWIELNQSMLWGALLRVTLLLLLSLLTCQLLLRRRSAALRHQVWMLTLASTLFIPLAMLLLPRWEVAWLPPLPSLPGPAVRAPLTIEAPVNEGVDPPRSISPPASAVDSQPAERGADPKPLMSRRLDPATIGAVLWLVGALIGIVWMLCSVARQWRHVRGCPRIDDHDWMAAMDDALRTLGMKRKIDARVSDRIAVPAVVGVLRPCLLVSTDWPSWSLAQRNCVLLHELAHIQRRDVAAQWLGRIAAIVYWFHPLVWHAIRSLRDERELATDDCVLRTGQTASEYAEQLLEIIRGRRGKRPGAVVGVAMGKSARGRLDQRVRAILSTNRRREPLGRVRATALAMLAAVAAVIVGGLSLSAPVLADPASAEPMWREVYTVEYNGRLPVSVAYSGDGKRLLTGDTSGELMMLIFTQDDPQWRWKKQVGGEHPAVAFSADEKQVYATTAKGVQVLDAADGKLWPELLPAAEGAPHPTVLGVFPNQKLGPAKDVIFSRVVFGSAHGYRVASWAQRKFPDSLGAIDTSTVVDGKAPPAAPLAMDPKGRCAIMLGPADASGKNVLWAYVCGDYSEGSPGNRLMPGHDSAVVSAAWSRDGAAAATGDEKGRFIYWDGKTMKPRRQMELGGRVVAIAISNDGSRTAAWVASSEACKLYVWPTDKEPSLNEPIHTELGDFDDAGAMASLCFSPDGKRLAGATGHKKWLSRLGELVGRARVWELGAAPEAQPAPKLLYARRLSPQGDDTHRGPLDPSGKWRGPWDLIRFMDRHTLLTTSRQDRGAIDMRSVEDGKIQARLRLGEFIVGDVLMSADRKWMAIEHLTPLDEKSTSPPRRTMDVGIHQSTLVRDSMIRSCDRLLAISAKGECVAVLREQQVEVWSIPRNRSVATAPFEHVRIDAAAFSPERHALALVDRNTLVLWHWDTGKHERIRLRRSAGSLVFSSDGKLLAEGPGPRKSVRIRDAHSLEVLRELKNAQDRSMDVRNIVFAQGGRLLIATDALLASDKGPQRIHMWDVKTGRPTRSIELPNAMPIQMDVSPNGRYLAVTTDEGEAGFYLRVWRLDGKSVNTDFHDLPAAEAKP